MHTAGSTLSDAQQLSLTQFGGNLRASRQRQKETLEEVARKTRLGVATIRRAESGDPTVRIGVYILLTHHYNLDFLSPIPS